MGSTCYCGKPATHLVYYGTGRGQVCENHAHRILKIKALPPRPPYLVPIATVTTIEGA